MGTGKRRQFLQHNLAQLDEDLALLEAYTTIFSWPGSASSTPRIKTLSRHYGITFPLFIENRESLTWLPPQNTQVISLVAREEVPELKMEVEEWPETGWDTLPEKPMVGVDMAMMEIKT